MTEEEAREDDLEYRDDIEITRQREEAGGQLFNLEKKLIEIANNKQFLNYVGELHGVKVSSFNQEVIDEIKQLISDAIDYVTPERLALPKEESDTDWAYGAGNNAAIDVKADIDAPKIDMQPQMFDMPVNKNKRSITK